MTEASTTRSEGVRSGNPDRGVTRDMAPIVPSRAPLANVPADGNHGARGVATAPNADEANLMSSQFQIIWEDFTLPEDSAGGYPVVGKVTAGLSIVGGIAQAGTITGDSERWPAVSVIINEVTIK